MEIGLTRLFTKMLLVTIKTVMVDDYWPADVQGQIDDLPGICVQLRPRWSRFSSVDLCGAYGH